MSRDDTPLRRTGVTVRSGLRRAPPGPEARLTWGLLAAGVVLAAIGVGWVLGGGASAGGVATMSPGPSPPASVAPSEEPASRVSPSPAPDTSPQAAPTLTSAVTPEPSPDLTAPPTAADTPEPSPDPTATATPEPSPDPTATPTATATSEPTPAPTAGLIIDFPADGETVVSRVINVIGTGPPGATITRDVPLWFDDHTTVREDGIWMLRVELAAGSNRLAFRIGDDRSTEARITVVYEPRT